MVFPKPRYSIALGIMACIAGLILCQCEEESNPQAKKHVEHVLAESITHYTSDMYVLHLSLAKLILEADNANASLAKPDYDIAKAYSEQKQNTSTLQPVILLQYIINGETTPERTAIPFSMPHNTTDFPGLEDVMNRLHALSYKIYDLRIAAVNITPSPALASQSADPVVALKTVDDRLQLLIHKAVPLPPMVQARIELQLTTYFMQHHYKEAAYLSIENAKQSLSAVTDSDSADAKENTHVLFQAIDAEEKLLYKTMPFTFDF